MMYDRCTRELRDTGRCERSLPAQDTSTVYCIKLGHALAFPNYFICLNRHTHAAEGASSCKHWTWDAAQRITEGIRLGLVPAVVGHSIVPVYPTFHPNIHIARTPHGGEPHRGVDHIVDSISESTCQVAVAVAPDITGLIRGKLYSAVILTTSQQLSNV